MKTIHAGLFLLCMSALVSASSAETSGAQSAEWKSRCVEAQRLFQAGQLNRAETAYVEALRLARAMPVNADAVFTSLKELALFYMNTRRFDNAVQALSESLALQTKALGTDDPGLATTLNLLGASYRALRRYDDALAAHQRALSILKNAKPEPSSEIGLTLSALGSLADIQCHFTKAQNYFTSALDYLDRAPSGAPTTLARVSTWVSLGSEYVLFGNFEKAKPLFARALKSIDMPQYAQTGLLVETLDRAAVSLFDQRRFTDAERLWKRALSITTPQSRCYRLFVLIHLAELQSYFKEHDQAKDLLSQAEQLYDQLYQTHGDLFSMILADRGLVAMAAGDKRQATALLDRALEVSRACKNRDLVHYSEILSYRAGAAEAEHDLITAKTMLGEASRIQRAALGESRVTANCFLAYAHVLKKMKLKSEAKEYERTAKTMLDRLPATRSEAYTVDVKALRQGW